MDTSDSELDDASTGVRLRSVPAVDIVDLVLRARGGTTLVDVDVDLVLFDADLVDLVLFVVVVREIGLPAGPLRAPRADRPLSEMGSDRRSPRPLMSGPATKCTRPTTMIQIAIAVAASVLLVASFITFEPAATPGTVRLSTGEKASPVSIGSAGADLPVLPAPAALTSETGGTRLQGSGQPPPPASAYTHMMFSSGV